MYEGKVEVKSCMCTHASITDSLQLYKLSNLACGDVEMEFLWCCYWLMVVAFAI